MTTIRRLGPDDRDALLSLKHFAFVTDPSAERPEHEVSGLDLDRTFGFEHPDLSDQFAGVYSSYDLKMRTPGDMGGASRLVPLNGLTWVAVHPDMRRRGILRQMIAHHLEAARDRGEAVAGLHASEPGIYGRFGYAVASHDVGYSLGRGTAFTAPASVVEVADATTVATVLDVDDDAWVRRIVEVSRRDPAIGTIVLPGVTVRRRLRDKAHTRVGKEPLRAYVATRDGSDVGIALFRRSSEWTDGNPGGAVDVSALLAVDAGAMLALGRRLVDVDLMSSVSLPDRGLDDLLLTWAGNVRQRSVRVADALWLRPVDVAGMLTSRGYSAPLDVTLDIRDATCPWNAGSWRLVVDASGEAECERTSREPDLDLDVDVLGELYLGLRGATALAAQGRIVEHTPGAVAALTTAFSTGIAPLGGAVF